MNRLTDPSSTKCVK